MNRRLMTLATALGENIGERFLLLRNGQPLLALPPSGDGVRRALNLYQPQRLLAKWMALFLQRGAHFGLHRLLLEKAKTSEEGILSQERILPPTIDRASLGVLFGSADHKIFRAVLSYRNAGCWEVGKFSFGEEGSAMLEREAAAMCAVAAVVPEVPTLLGLEKTGNSRLLRMPYLHGRCLASDDVAPVRELLEAWLSCETHKPLATFSEWHAIAKALGDLRCPEVALTRLAQRNICSSIRHGDLARWNLLRLDNGSLTALDWEWGEKDGLAGIDLVHYLAQDLRLVRRLPINEVMTECIIQLKSAFWQPYLRKTGWSGHEQDLFLAYLAFKQGAGHQDNAEILGLAAAAFGVPLN